MKIKVYCEITRSGIMGTGGTETSTTELVSEIEAESRASAIKEFKDVYLTEDRTFCEYENGKVAIRWRNQKGHIPYTKTVMEKEWYMNL